MSPVDEPDDVTLGGGLQRGDLVDPSAPFTLLIHHRGGAQGAPLRPGQAVVIGRGPPAGLILQEPKLSRVHVKFEVIDGKVWVEDLASRNGTQVNGQAVTRCALGPGDQVMLPEVTILVHSRSAAAESNDAQQLRREVEDARQLQGRMVGPSQPIECGPLQLAAFYEPVSACGGDFWNYFKVGKSKTLVVIGDVTGHGMPTAMLTAAVKSCCDTLVATHGARLSLVTLVRTLNHVVWEARRQPMTLFASLFDERTRELAFANAAHPRPILCRQAAGGPRTQLLSATGPLLGLEAELEVAVERCGLRPQDVLVWFTDGLIERENAGRTAWGGRRLGEVVLANASRPAGEIRDTILTAAAAFCGAERSKDDVTVVVGKLAR
ncbi:MAG: SpoIIE family protein phosphatase [Myxococcales bacterium]|nr:SpoIIE family protein phosphatase [Myxococcales bacterium]